jgi:hypothetical protein
MDIEDWDRISVYAAEVRDLLEQDILSAETATEVAKLNKKKILCLLKPEKQESGRKDGIQLEAAEEP